MSQSWDPMLEALKRRFEDDILPAVRAQTKFRKWRRYLWTFVFRLKNGWLDVLFLLLTAIPLVAGAVVLAASYPWSAEAATPLVAGAAGVKDYAGVVVTGATATAFGGVLFSLVAAPLKGAAELAAGYSAELLRRSALWLTGAWLSSLAIGLFVLAAINPDQEAAIAAGLLTGSSLAMVWAAARSLLASSDPQDVARRVARFIQKGMKGSRTYSRRLFRGALPAELRDEPQGVLMVRQEERRIVNGFLRHYKAGIEGALAHRQPTSAIVLWDSMLVAFIEYAREVDGDIGDSQGITETLFSTVDLMVQQGLAIPLDDVATHPITSLEQLVDINVNHSSYAVVRSVALIKLKTWTQAAWNDDNTRVPAAALSSVGALLRHAVRVEAHEDAIHALSALHELGAQGIVDRRVHIGKKAMEEIVSALRAFLSADPKLRGYLVKRWAQEAQPLSRLRLVEANVYLMRPTEVIFPGISIWGAALQEVLAELAPYVHISSEVMKPLAEWLHGALGDFGARQETPLHYFAVDALALTYCLALTQAHAVAAGKPPRPDEAQLLCDVVVSWATRVADEDVGDALLNPDSAEMIWSVLLATAYAAGDAHLLAKAAKPILERLTPRLEEGRPLYDSFSVEFVTGLMLALDWSDQQIREVTAKLEDPHDWGGGHRGMHIDGLGRVPAVNQNRAAIYAPGVYEIINAWAVEQFPRFAS